jgi:nucleotide-binding universal stress UspA family protein
VKVLIAVDGSSRDALSVHTAASRPWPPGSSFCILNVFNPYPFTAAPIIQERLVNKIRSSLESSAQVLRDTGWAATTEIVFGSARRAVIHFARDWNAGLVMVGCNALSDLTRLVLGSTAQSVMRHAPCSVEIVRPPPGRSSEPGASMKILIATDGSEFSLAALRSVASRPWPAASMAKVFSVPELLFLKNPSYLETHEYKQLGAASIEDARISVAAGVGTLAGSGLQVSSEVSTREERPWRVILDEAESWGANLIVVGSHGRSGFDRVVMGSVSEAVTMHAKCSVEVIRSP